MKKKIILLSAKIFSIISYSYISIYSFDAFANQRKNPFRGASVNVHKREDKHIKTSALICALVETKASSINIKTALFDQFPKPINDSDKFLIIDSMLKMCPLIDPKNIIKNATIDFEDFSH